MVPNPLNGSQWWGNLNPSLITLWGCKFKVTTVTLNLLPDKILSFSSHQEIQCLSLQGNLARPPDFALARQSSISQLSFQWEMNMCRWGLLIWHMPCPPNSQLLGPSLSLQLPNSWCPSPKTWVVWACSLGAWWSWGIQAWETFPNGSQLAA